VLGKHDQVVGARPASLSARHANPAGRVVRGDGEQVIAAQGPRGSARRSLVEVHPESLLDWFDKYLRAFAACGRGESDDLDALLAYYGVPLVLTTDAAALVLATEDEVLSAIREQIGSMRAAGYDRSDTLSSELTPLNATTALHTAELSRRSRDGSEIGRLRATYLIVAGADGRRISALVVRTR
jgi:hypothetical protein